MAPLHMNYKTTTYRLLSLNKDSKLYFIFQPWQRQYGPWMYKENTQTVKEALLLPLSPQCLLRECSVSVNYRVRLEPALYKKSLNDFFYDLTPYELKVESILCERRGSAVKVAWWCLKQKKKWPFECGIIQISRWSSCIHGNHTVRAPLSVSFNCDFL